MTLLLLKVNYRKLIYNVFKIIATVFSIWKIFAYPDNLLYNVIFASAVLPGIYTLDTIKPDNIKLNAILSIDEEKE